MDKKVKLKAALVFGATVILSLLMFLSETGSSSVKEIERNHYGEGGKKNTFEVTVEGEQTEEDMDIEVSEREYTREEIQEVFRESMDELDKLILGENKSADHVEGSLNLVTQIPGQPVEVTWESGTPGVVDSTGNISEENLTEEGEMVELRGLLRYREEECLYLANVMVYPRTLTSGERLWKNLEELVYGLEEEDRTEPVVKLPGEIDGRKVTWKLKRENQSVWILLLGSVAAVMVCLQERQKKQKEKTAREKQMKLDYPEVVSQIALLVEAGMTVRKAWERIEGNYRDGRTDKNIRFAYEEMGNTVREMQGGVTESECYERFGKRCGIPCYLKLGTLLSQNLRKGTKGLAEILTGESGQAFEERRQMAKRQGEEVSTKLLLPMSLMLVVVLVIVIVPAFLSISL